jgi:ATP-binding cassette subfamily C (CFTR/MRP) protein 1
MLGFTETITEIVQALRVSELRLSTRFRKLLCVRVALANSTPCLSQILILFVHLELSYPTWSIV